jgi:hypothetical protein
MKEKIIEDRLKLYIDVKNTTCEWTYEKWELLVSLMLFGPQKKIASYMPE